MEEVESVRVEVNENRVLAPSEVADLVTAYRDGASALALARRFGVHRETVRQQLRRVGVEPRPQLKVTAERLMEARRLYAEGWSTQRIGKQLGLSQSTVYKALRRAGVAMRPPVA